jgi:hypothetical protein
MRRRSRLGLLDWIGSLRATRRQIDGLWVGVSPVYQAVTNEDTAAGLRRVEEALGLIRTYDRLRYDRLTRDLERIWVRTLIHYAGLFTPSLNLCELDCRFVANRGADAVASMIVHEATHARLRRCGIGNEETIRARVEAVCIRREIAFSTKLPDGKEVRKWAEVNLETYAVPEVLTNAARERLIVETAARELRELGFSERLISAVLRFRRILRSLRAARQSLANSARRLIRA